jgi:hypothetical protein
VKHMGRKTNNTKLYSFPPSFFWSTDLLVKISRKKAIRILLMVPGYKILKSDLVYARCFVIIYVLAYKLLYTCVTSCFRCDVDYTGTLQGCYVMYGPVRTHNFCWGADPEAIFNLCLILKTMLQKSCRKYNITLFATAFIYVRI